MSFTTGQTLRLPWGSEQLAITLPAAWEVTGVLEPVPFPPVADAAAEVRRSLAAPIGMPGLRDLATASARCVLVVDDGSRPTPVSAILPPVLDELAAAGLYLDQVTLVTALGVHRPMTEPELSERVGAGVLARVQWENHDCDDPGRLVHLGVTRRGTEVWVNRTVAEADLVISIGCIEPHIIASFGGGAKNIVPGVAGRITIGHNHALNCTRGTWTMVGRPVELNPMRLDLEEAVGLLAGRLFVVNAILDAAKRIVRVVAGDAVAAHRAGLETSARISGMAVAEPADIVIASSHPMDQDLRQGVKALANTLRAVRPGGVHLTLARAEEGVGVMGVAQRRLPIGRSVLRLLAPVLLMLVPRLRLRGMGEEERFFLYFALQAMRRASLLLYAPTVPTAARAAMPFVRFIESPEEAIALARRQFPGRARVLVFPHGGTTYVT
jgi:nickel-dependent lactate racemase